MESNDQPVGQLDDMSKDDASIEIVSESGDSHFRDSQWSIYSAGRSSIAGSDVSSTDFQKLSIHSKMATIVHHDGRQFIERRDLDDGGLPYSAEFYLGDEVWKVNGEDCLLLSHRRYIAKVCVEGTVDLEGAVDFEEAVRTLLKHLKVVKVLLDEQLEECNKAKSVLELILDKLATESERNIDYKRDVMLLRILLKKHGNSLNMDFKHDLDNNPRLSSEIMTALDSFVTKSLKLIQRNEILDQLRDSSLSDELINDVLQKTLIHHQGRLAAICPSTLKDKLNELPDDYIMYVSTDDVNLFNDLTTLDQDMFESVLPMIFCKFLIKLQEINKDQLVDLEPLSKNIFLYICKSLQEVAEQFGSHTNNDSVISYSEANGWEVSNVQKESQTPYNKCLRQQLQMLAKLANHFEPGGPFRTNHFPYEFKLFQNMDAIPEPVRIWLCLLDDCMKDLVQADMDKMQMLSCFFKSYVSFIASEEFPGETLECLRRITHDALRSLIDMQSSSQHDRTTSDSDSLEYNGMISCCLDKFFCEHFGNDCNQIQKTLRRIIGQVMNKKVASEELTEFSYVFKQLVKEISDLPLEWFVQLPPSENRNLLVRGQFVVPVDNRWKDTEHECLKVMDPEGFVKMFKLLHNGEEIPKHYQLKVIQVLLDKLAAKQSCYEGKLLDAMTNMINSIRDSILYLNRQPEYSCFEEFLQMMDESFPHAFEERRSLEDIRNPMSPMNELKVTDPPHTIPTDIGETNDPSFDLFEGSISRNLLTSGLKIHSTQFNKHITETAQLQREKRIEQIVSEVVLKVRPQLATSWTEEFRRNELPEVLAGLSSVWSLVVSKNDNSLEELIKPSNLQISFILRFFDDQNQNDDNLYRLLNISTQQGKELVLGLTAALSALYGHKVLIACYNSNLARRNSTNLIELFKSFSIDSSITFGSIEDMARERSRELYDRYATYIHKCLGIESNTNNGIKPKHPSEDKRSILLIEDIDIFLQCRTLGETFQRFVRPTIPGLGLLQEKMFALNRIPYESIQRFIVQSDNPEIRQLNAFRNRQQSYKLIEHNALYAKEWKNHNLLHNHLQEWRCNNSTKLRLSSNGVMMKKHFEKFENSDTAYFILETSNFQQIVEGYKNYGYLTLGCIPFPYAHLLRSYSHVLGFASAPLDGYEEITLHTHYNINRHIAMQNPLGITAIKFDPEKDFLCVESKYEQDWMIAIMVAINAAIKRNCSVLVFFKSEVEMDNFQSKFALHLKHLSVTAIKTASNGENLSEDEIAVDEVTVLAIEADDRYGHLAEEREVHVIQTFWWVDSKEEDLIRRQAERSYGSGSYELVVFMRDLPPGAKNLTDQLTYDLLVKLREPRSFGKALDCLEKNMKFYVDLEKKLHEIMTSMC